MSHRNWLFAVSAAAVLTPVAWLAAQAATPSEPASAIERGRYLVTLAGCNRCHTPWAFNKDLGMPAPDMTRMLSGHPADAPAPAGTLGPKDIALIGPTFTSFKMPFGVVYAANLTPDRDTGLGSWTEAMFRKAFRSGKHMGGDGRAVVPPMPWMDLARATDEDLKAVFAYLRSIPAIRNPVPDHQVPSAALDAITQKMGKLAAVLAGGH